MLAATVPATRPEPAQGVKVTGARFLQRAAGANGSRGDVFRSGPADGLCALRGLGALMSDDTRAALAPSAAAAEAFLRRGQAAAGCFAVAAPWLCALQGIRLVSGGWLSMTDAEREELLHASAVGARPVHDRPV